ncbi:hypothetical protein EV207_12356 [Scopulibacillus darangshiensis]|uniref:Uncharacterized protein n=1 Tax=Scopulibacillus darangshiensis TaxID=442528 RepID=A0A4R2NSG1_9BACL|nr:hypothetical protein [Scopulibacillus darangshiensis]TCP24883.1 hypothetical protein EV207_12356 [Scopulibacillus darangshiensis]
MNEEIIDHYHCCASCRHFRIQTGEGKRVTMCSRLGYETKPGYQFNCWDPKPRVKRAMERKLNKG